MSRPVWQAILLFFLSLALPNYSYSHQDLPETIQLTSKPRRPIPPLDLFEQWVENPFEADELWFFKDSDSFENLLKESGLEDSLQAELRSLVKGTISGKDARTTMTFAGSPDIYDQAKLFLFINKQIWDKLPHEFITLVYQYHLKEFSLTPSMWYKTESQTLQEYLKQIGVRPDRLERLKKGIIKIEGEERLLMNSLTWPDLPDRIRVDTISSLIRSSDSQKGLEIAITLTEHNITQVVHAFAGERDSATLEGELRERIRTSGQEQLTLDLKEILHPFIQKMLNQFASCFGPNCFDTATNVHRGQGYRDPAYLHTPDLLRYLYKNFRFVHPSEKLRTGDVLLFEGFKNNTRTVEVQHVATYIAGNYVFTKNGLNKFNPYLLQDLQRNIDVYYKDKPYQLIVFRAPEPDRKVVSEYGYFFGEPIFYQEHPSLKYAPLGYDPLAPLEERKKALSEFMAKWPDEKKARRLAMLREEPHAIDVKHLIELHLARVKGVPNSLKKSLREFGIQPNSSREEMRAALRNLLELNSLSMIQKDAIRWLSRRYPFIDRETLQELADKFHILLPQIKRERCDLLLEQTVPVKRHAILMPRFR